MKKTLSIIVVAALLVVPSLSLAHPHFNKSVTAKLPGGADATISYNTTPANMEHAKNAETGKFITPRGPSLKLSSDVTIGGQTIPAGEHTIGVIKNGENDYTMAIYQGGLSRGTEPDTSKIIKLDSMYSSDQGNAEHMLIDITPGHGKFEGKAVLTLHFGTMHLSGALS